MRTGRKLIVALAGAAIVASAPATANAAVAVSITGDDGNPLALAPGAPATIRNMDVRASIRVPAADAGSFSFQINDAANVGAATPQGCTTLRDFDYRPYVTYRGNTTYTLTVTRYTDGGCKTLKATDVYSWNVAAFVQIAPPAPTMFTRAANSFSTITQQFNFATNPGATIYEIKYAKGATLAPDGSLSSPALKDAYLNRTTGKVELIGAREPGSYMIVARAKSGDFYTPWTAAVPFKLIAPFDISSRRFPDARGPSYQVQGTVGETTASGRVTIAIANGKKGKRFRTLGKAKINSKGVFKLRFRINKRGYYRVRYSFKGSETVARGTIYEVIQIRRIIG